MLFYTTLYDIILDISYYIIEECDCGEHGNCNTENGTPKCVCDSGWIGDDCSIGI